MTNSTLRIIQFLVEQGFDYTEREHIIKYFSEDFLEGYSLGHTDALTLGHPLTLGDHINTLEEKAYR